MTDLATWLLAKINEDEDTIRAIGHRLSPEGDTLYYACPESRTEPLGDLQWGPGTCDCGLYERRKRVIVECDAKRRIVELHTTSGTGTHECPDGRYWASSGLFDKGHAWGWCPTLTLLALPYADREGYDEEEWAPDYEQQQAH